ncbi:50S ribosomal protein L29 [candidate division SR1 bacterium Aalborg_AAW-1]|nr:50S ribosomal protein L29 [candidate division SR1 bacterium Aalborg_AAW-1]
MSRKTYLKDLISLSVKDLVQKRKELKKELFDLKMKNLTGALKKVSDVRSARRNIARINTVLSHKIATLYGSSVK